MAKILFDIKYRPQIESGEYKVEIRDGRPARIVCWDRQHEDYPLIVLISCDGGEDCEIYTIDGKFYCNQEAPAYDLIIITPEPELSEFEKALDEFGEAYATLVDRDNNPNQGIGINSYHELVKENISKILELAKEYIKQEQQEVALEKEMDQWRHDHFKGERDGEHNGEYFKRESQLDLARHFFELGKNAKIANNE